MNVDTTKTEPRAGTAGALLRAARERQGLHIAALAAAIKVAPRKLEALEGDRWHELPDATFARALAQTVCRTLKVDPRPVLELLPPAGRLPASPVSTPLNTPFQDRPGRDQPGLAGAPIRTMVWSAVLLLVAAVAVVAIPDRLAAESWQALIAAVPKAVAALIPGAATPPRAGAPAPVLPTLPSASAALAVPALAPASGTQVQVGEAPQPTGETVFSAPSTVPTAAAGLVQLRTSEASWIEVRDNRGQLVLSRTVLPGESVGLDGNLPLQLTIGNAVATQLSFRGQAVDLSARTRDNVARIDLQ